MSTKKTAICAMFLFLGLIASPLFADHHKGEVIYVKKLEEPCNMNCWEMAEKHSQEEWKAIQQSGVLNEELVKLCPNAHPLKESHVEHFYHFLYAYAAGSGEMPECRLN